MQQYRKLFEYLREPPSKGFHPIFSREYLNIQKEERWIKIIPYSPEITGEDIDIQTNDIPYFDCKQMMVAGGAALEMLIPILEQQEYFGDRDWWLLLFLDLLDDLREPSKIIRQRHPLSPYDPKFDRLIESGRQASSFKCAVWNMLACIKICNTVDHSNFDAHNQLLKTIRLILQILAIAAGFPIDVYFLAAPDLLPRNVNPENFPFLRRCYFLTQINRTFTIIEEIDPRKAAQDTAKAMQIWADQWQAVVEARLAFSGEIED